MRHPSLSQTALRATLRAPHLSQPRTSLLGTPACFTCHATSSFSCGCSLVLAGPPFGRFWPSFYTAAYHHLAHTHGACNMPYTLRTLHALALAFTAPTTNGQFFSRHNRLLPFYPRCRFMWTRKTRTAATPHAAWCAASPWRTPSTSLNARYGDDQVGSQDGLTVHAAVIILASYSLAPACQHLPRRDAWD